MAQRVCICHYHVVVKSPETRIRMVCWAWFCNGSMDPLGKGSVRVLEGFGL